MAITKVRELPTALPHAHLYLDDVEEICQILTGAHKNDKNKASDLRFSTVDTRMESIEDLQNLGGSATEFTIAVGGFGGISIRFNSFLQPELRMYAATVEEHWAVYSRINAIFEHRRYHIKNTFAGLPGWVVWPILFLLLITPDLLYYRQLQLHPIIHWGLHAVFVVLILSIYFRPSRVSFVRSTERSKVRADAWKNNLAKFCWIVIAAAVGSVVTILAQHLFPALKK